MDDIVDALSFTSDETHHYVDRESGSVVTITDEDIRAANDESLRAPEWQRELIEIARAIRRDSSGRYVPLPETFDIDEWDIMKRFARRAGPGDALLNAIEGSGAFRRFKDAIHRFGLTDQWHTFKDESLRSLALNWCREQGIEVKEASPTR